ncbi:MAG: HD domain-containing phosphohydrolase [Candidatus Latescibacterota bacterium]
MEKADAGGGLALLHARDVPINPADGSRLAAGFFAVAKNADEDRTITNRIPQNSQELALGLCGLTHDLGMLKVPEEVLGSRRLTSNQLQFLQQHPQDSERIVRAFGKAFEWVGKVVVQVHERRDGSGYPNALKGDDIHEFARIIGLVDTYEAMAQPRADRQARVTYNALKEIIDLRNSLFDRRLIKALIHIVSIFPLGSLVKLNNVEIGRVVATSRLHPTRRTIDVLIDPRGRRLPEPRQIDLQAEPMLYIVDPAIEEGVLGGP